MNVVFPPTSIDVDHKSLLGMQVNTSALKLGSGVVLIRFISRIRKVVRGPESLPLSNLIAVCATFPEMRPWSSPLCEVHGDGHQ